MPRSKSLRIALVVSVLGAAVAVSLWFLVGQEEDHGYVPPCRQHAAAALDAGAAVPSPGEAALLSNIRQLTFGGKRSGEGYFSADGSKLIFQSEREPQNPFFQIYLLDLRTGESRRLSPGHGKTTCGWVHPGGQRALFASTHLDPRVREKQKKEIAFRAAGKKHRYAWDYDERYDLFEVNLGTGALRRLSSARGYDAEGAYSPDGNLIVFASNRAAFDPALPLSEADRKLFAQDPSYLMDLYLMNADGTNVRRLTRTPGYDGGPFFSADGRKICWRRFSKDGRVAEIYTMNPDGTGEGQLTRLGAMSWAPFFHPSGDYLIFTTNRHGFANFELYLVDALGKAEPVRVTYTDGFDGLPAFSPDGQQVTWTSGRTGNKKPQIFLADWNDAEARRLLGLPAKVQAPREPSAAPDDRWLRRQLGVLASEAMEGRMTGTDGERRAAEHLAATFREVGLEPAGEGGTFFQEFSFVAGASLGQGNRLAVRGAAGKSTRDLKVDTDWRPLAFSKTGPVPPSEIAFAGYGIAAPATKDHAGYDSFAHVEVRDRWVMVFRYLPEGISPELRQHWSQFASLRYKATESRGRGARGLIVVSGPTSKVKSDLVKLALDASLTGTGIPAVSVTDAVAEELLLPSGKRLKDLQEKLDTGAPVAGFVLPGVDLGGEIALNMERRKGRNVLARLPGSGAAGAPALVVGAHYDHLGRGHGTSSMARGEERGQIHPGADDNASGVTGMLEIARSLAQERAAGTLRPRREVIFAAWSGEEIGLLGSSHFVRAYCGEGHEPCKRKRRIAAYLNLDQVGRLQKSLVLQGVASSSAWPGAIERANAALGLPIVTQSDAYLPTDATAFYPQGVPILSAFTGVHAEHHSPRDTADKIHYAGIGRIARLLLAIARPLATGEGEPDYQKVQKPKSQDARRGTRVYLGTIPDFSAGDVTGVKLSGVAGGGPAEAAGVRGGDVIVELAGKRVENIYDYTYAMGALKIGVPVDLVVLRQSERLKLKVTPRSRE